MAETQQGDRKWTKNLLTRARTTCIGTNVGRNWPGHWSADNDLSMWPCRPDFRGDSPKDTAEVKVLERLVQDIFGHNVKDAWNSRIKLFIDWTSNGQHSKPCPV